MATQRFALWASSGVKINKLLLVLCSVYFKGFSEVMPVNLLYNFDAQELEFLMTGTLEIDIDDWRVHTEYRNGKYIIVLV